MKAEEINIKERLQCLETKVERLRWKTQRKNRKARFDARGHLQEGNFRRDRQGSMRDAREHQVYVYENEKMPVGTSSELENNTSDEGNERHLNGRLEEIRLADRIQKDTMERDQASQRRNGVEVQQWYDGNYSYCSQSQVLKVHD